MKVKKGDKIKVEYTGMLEDGTVFDTTTHGAHTHPIEFTVGEGLLIKGFESAVVGMEVGEEKEIKLESKDAYGEPNDKLKNDFPRDKFPKSTEEPKEGMNILLGLEDGRNIPAKIIKVTDKIITIDFNHPLTGKTLIFKIKVKEIGQ